MINQYKTPSYGFSLLEVTFVILLISITVVSTGLYIHNANEKAAAKQIALQINYWLNAAVNYYSVNTSWPTDLNTLASSVGETFGRRNTLTHYKYQFISNNNDFGKGASIQIELPSEAFALMVQSNLSRAIVEKQDNQATLYAYTPPVATRIPSEVQMVGVGYLHFYNCKSNGKYHNHKKECRPKKPESPCIDPANSRAYKINNSPYYENDSQYAQNHSAGVCVMPVPQCADNTVPQIYYALSQFRAPFGPYPGNPYGGPKSDNHDYQTYPYQVDVMCQMHSENGNLGPCGPNAAKLSNVKNKLKYWAISISMRNSHFGAGVTKGIQRYDGPQNPSRSWGGSYYDEHFDRWSALVSYVVACVPTIQIIDQVSGGVVRYMGSDNSTCYSQEMMSKNSDSNACANTG